MYQRYYATGFIAAAIVVSALFVTPVMAAAAADDTVIAIVNGDKIMKKDVMTAIKKLPPQAQSSDTQQLFPLVVDEIINEKLIDDATTAAKIEQSDDYKKQLDAIKAQLAKQLYVEKVLKDKVSDAAIKSEYNKFKKENEGKQEIHAKHLLVKTEEEAKQAIKDLDDGAKFEDIVKQRSSDTSSARTGGDLGWFAEEDMVPEFSNAAFQIKPGSYSKEPVKTKFGYHVIKVEDKRVRQVPDLKTVEPAIRQKLTQDAVKALIQSLRSKAQIKMFDKDGEPLDAEKKGKQSSTDKPAKKDAKSDDDKPAKDDAKSDKKDDSDKSSDKSDDSGDAAKE